MTASEPLAYPVPPISFSDAAVVQLVAGDPDDPDARVEEVHRATVTVSPRAVVATGAGMRWEWPIPELVSVHHASGAGWSILAVPGVVDHGVAVADRDRAGFRRALAQVRGDVEVLDLERLADLPGDPAPSEEVRVPPPRPPLASSAWLDSPAPGPSTPLPTRPEPVHLPPPPAPDAVEAASPPRAAESRRWRRARRARDQRSQPLAGPAAAGPRELASLEARSVSAWFGDHRVLDRIDLTMQPGQVTALIGPSGCGKSTFLRILNRMHELVPSASLAGEVRLDGVDVYDPSRRVTDARRQIGMVFQKPNPFPAMSIYDNVVAGFRLTGAKSTAAGRDEVVESCLAKAGLWKEVRDRLRQPGGGLSGGQQQRLCIARALAVRPRVLLMDEPCSALDPTSTRRIEQTIVELASEVTIVIVTHNMQQAARVSNQCAFFLAEAGTPGVIVEHGPTDAMFSEPRDDRTAAYVNGRFG